MATKPIYPRGNKEGSLGSSTRKWNQGYIVSGSFDRIDNTMMYGNTASFNGPVGIGLDNPTFPLQVSGSSNMVRFNSTNGNYINFADTSSGMMVIRTITHPNPATDLANAQGMRVDNISSVVGVQSGIHLTSNSAFAGIIGRRVGANQQALDFYTENGSDRWVNMTINSNGDVLIGSGSLTVNGVISGSVVAGNNRSSIVFGRSGSLNTSTTTNVSASTVDNIKRYGYRLPFSGQVSAITFELDKTQNSAGTDTFKAIAQLNGVDQSMSASTDIVAGENGAINTDNPFNFNAGDKINCSIQLSAGGAGSCTVKDVSILVCVEM